MMPSFFSDVMSCVFQAPFSNSPNHAETIDGGKIKHLPRQSRFELVVTAAAVSNSINFFVSVFGFVFILLNGLFFALCLFIVVLFLCLFGRSNVVCLHRFICATIDKIILLDTYPFFALATELSKLIFFHIPKSVQEIFDLNNTHTHTFQWNFLLCHWCFISYSFSRIFLFSLFLWLAFYAVTVGSLHCCRFSFGLLISKSDFRHLFYYSMLVCHIKSELSCETKQECIKIIFENPDGRKRTRSIDLFKSIRSQCRG